MTYVSSINPNLPAMDAPIASSPVRENFAATYSDINFIYGLIAALPVAAGTVTSVAGTNANGITWSIANPTTTANITISLGAITPSSVNGVTISGTSTPTLAVSGTTSVSGSNTGDQTIHLMGDVTGSGTGTFSTTLANTAVSAGSYTTANITVDSKGRITSASNGTTSAPFSSVTSGTATGQAFVIGAGSSLTPTGGGTITATTNANLTGPITSVGNATVIASQTGTGTKFVMDTAPTITAPILLAPNIGTPTTAVLTNATGTASGLTAGAVSTISGLISAGSNVTITGSGTQASPYSIASSGGGGSSAFNALTSGTNTIAAMVVGSGASLGATGSGIITPSTINGLISASTNITITGSGTASSPYEISASSSAGSSFNSITSGTNTTAAMVVGSGGSLGVSGSGTIAATTVTTINGKIAAGSNISISGSGTSGSPYSIGSSPGVSGLTANSTGAAAANVTALQTALTAGGDVYIASAGTYYINASLSISSNTVLRGIPGVIIRCVTATNAPALVNANQGSFGTDNNITLRGITFDGDQANQTVGFTTVYFKNATSITCEDCQFNRGLRTGTFPTVSDFGEGIRFNACQYIYVSNCAGNNNIYDGFKIWGSTDFVFDNCIAVNNGRAGIQLTYGDGTYITTPGVRGAVSNFTVYHSTGTPSAASPVTSGIYLHSADYCAISNFVSDGPQQVIGIYDNTINNTFTGIVGKSFAANGIGMISFDGFTNMINNIIDCISLYPLSGSSITYILMQTGAAHNQIKNLHADIGAGSGTGAITLNSGTSNNTLNGLDLQNFSVSDSGTNNIITTGTTGTGNAVLATSPTLVTPALGTPASGVATNLTGTASGLTAGNVTTNANLTGPVTSSGNATSIASSIALPGSPTTTTQTALTSNTTIATTAYTDAAVATAVAGINPAVAVQYATTSASNTSGLTYSNGASGVGATFTGANNTATVIDGHTFVVGDVGITRLLVKNDTQSPSGAFNGIYLFTALHTSITGDIFTRALDYDQPSDINNTGAIPVISGTANAATTWVQTANIITVGTTPLAYTQFSYNPSSIVTTISGGTTGLTPSSATSGAITLAGTLAVANGGTGVTSSTGSGNVVLSTSPTLVTPALGTPASGVITNCTGSPTLTAVKATLSLDAINAVTVTSNAGTCPVTTTSDTFTNSSAATMAITIATSGAVDGQKKIVRIYDFSAAAQTIGWTNTENSTVSAPTTSNGSTTLPLTVGLIFNGATSKWRVSASC